MHVPDPPESLFDDPDDIRYWHSRTPEERLRHVETLRRLHYGIRATEGLQRVLEIVPLTYRPDDIPTHRCLIVVNLIGDSGPTVSPFVLVDTQQPQLKQH